MSTPCHSDGVLTIGRGWMGILVGSTADVCRHWGQLPQNWLRHCVNQASVNDKNVILCFPWWPVQEMER